MMDAICVGVRRVFFCAASWATSATTPATCGAAIDVPEAVASDCPG
jgi:hypothetical protein